MTGGSGTRKRSPWTRRGGPGRRWPAWRRRWGASGLVNGRGRVNGLLDRKGFINGSRVHALRLPTQEMRYRYGAVGAAAFLVLLSVNLAFGPFEPPTGMVVDGAFGDWTGEGIAPARARGAGAAPAPARRGGLEPGALWGGPRRGADLDHARGRALRLDTGPFHRGLPRALRRRRERRRGAGGVRPGHRGRGLGPSAHRRTP